jgi:hypothetical protein
MTFSVYWLSYSVYSSGGGRKSAKKEAVSEQPVEEDPADKAYWITTLPSGERTATQGPEFIKVPVKTAKICVASDPQTGQVRVSV